MLSVSSIESANNEESDECWKKKTLAKRPLLHTVLAEKPRGTENRHS